MQRRLPVLLLAVLLIAAALRCNSLVPSGIVTGDEALTALRSLGLLEQGHGWTPYWNGAPDVHKPPFYYWLVAVGYRLFGVGETALRAPSMVAFLCVLVLTFALGRRVFDPWTGLVAALLAGLHPTLAAQSCVGMLDTTMIALSLAAAYCLLRSEAAPVWFLGWGAFCGLALLTKGEGAVPILPASFLYLLAVRRSAFRVPLLYAGLALAAVLAGTWFGSQFLLHRAEFLNPHYDDFVDYRFKHSWRDPAMYLKSILYLWASWGALAPLLVAAPLLVWLHARSARGKEGGTQVVGTARVERVAPPVALQGALLIALLGVVPLVMVSLVRQQKQWYMLPAVVPMALFAARLLICVLRGDGPLACRVLPGVLLLIGLWLPGVRTGPPALFWSAAVLATASVASVFLRRTWHPIGGGVLVGGMVLTTWVGLSVENPLINLLRPQDPSVLRRLAGLLPTADAMPGALVVNFRHYPLNTLMFYARRDSVQLRTWSRSNVAPGTRQLGVLVGGGCREFFQGLDVKSLAEHGGYEIVVLVNRSSGPVVPGAAAPASSSEAPAAE